MPTKAPRTKAASGTAGAKKANPALQKPLRPSAELAAVVGPDPLPRGQAVSRVWGYIKEHGLQNPADRREILADDKLRPVFEVAPESRTGRFFSYAALAMVMSILACAGVRYPTLEWRRCRL